jgi:hypothetical protein
MKIRYGLWGDAGRPPSVEEFKVTVDFAPRTSRHFLPRR